MRNRFSKTFFIARSPRVIIFKSRQSILCDALFFVPVDASAQELTLGIRYPSNSCFPSRLSTCFHLFCAIRIQAITYVSGVTCACVVGTLSVLAFLFCLHSAAYAPFDARPNIRKNGESPDRGEQTTARQRSRREFIWRSDASLLSQIGQGNGLRNRSIPFCSCPRYG